MRLNLDKWLAVLCIGIIFILSCGKIYLKLVGVRKMSPVNKETLVNYLHKINIHDQSVLEVNPEKFDSLIQSKNNDSISYQSKDWYIQNHMQPTQTIFFNTETQEPIAAYFNCIAESRNLTNFTFNKYNELEFFPPLTYTEPCWIDSLFRLDELLKTICIMETNQTYLMPTLHKQKYLGLVFYSLFIEKQSTNIIRETQNFVNNCIKDSCSLVYINMDNYFYSQTK